jgi:hypothetical protein
MRPPPRHSPKDESAIVGYHKGDKHSGGGGHRGGGGKKGRPAGGWEKGDVVRDVDDHESPFQVKAKPGRRKRLLEEPTK